MVGAQQDRTFDVSVLVAPRSRQVVPVSCVEAGRWDGRRHREAFRPAPQAAYPELRRRKNEAARRSVAEGAGPRADQHDVWMAVSDASDRLGVDSATGAMDDLFERPDDRLAALRAGMRIHNGATGALVVLGGRPLVLDLVADAGAFVSVMSALMPGYALAALDSSATAADDERAVAEKFLADVVATSTTEAPAVGLGRDVRFVGKGVGGAGLAHEGSLIALSAFAEAA